MLTNEDVGKRVIIFDPIQKKWEPTVYSLGAIDTAIGNAYLDAKDKKSWVCPLKFIRVLDGY